MRIFPKNTKGRGFFLIIAIVVFLAFDAMLSLGLLISVAASDLKYRIPGHHLIVAGDGMWAMSERVVVASFKTPPNAYFLFSPSDSSVGLGKIEPLGVCIEGQLTARMTAATCLVELRKAAAGGGTPAWLGGTLALRWGELQAGNGAARRRLGEEMVETYVFFARNARGGRIHIEAAAARESDRLMRLFWVAKENGQANLEVIGKRPWWLIWRAAASITDKLFG